MEEPARAGLRTAAAGLSQRADQIRSTGSGRERRRRAERRGVRRPEREAPAKRQRVHRAAGPLKRPAAGIVRSRARARPRRFPRSDEERQKTAPLNEDRPVRRRARGPGASRRRTLRAEQVCPRG